LMDEGRKGQPRKVFRSEGMKIKYDPEADVLLLLVSP